MSAVDKVPVTLLGLAIAANLANHLTGHATICSTTRPLLPTVEVDEDTRTLSTTGKVIALSGVATFVGWFVPHYLNGIIR